MITLHGMTGSGNCYKPALVMRQHGETRTLAESNAMLCYLAEGSRLFPADRWTRAKILEWMFFEQYSHEPYIALYAYTHVAHQGGYDLGACPAVRAWLDRVEQQPDYVSMECAATDTRSAA